MLIKVFGPTKEWDNNDEHVDQKELLFKICYAVDFKLYLKKKFDINDDAQLDSAEFANMIEYDFDHFVNPHTLEYFQKLDANGDGLLSKVEFLVDVVAIETALGVDADQSEIHSYFDTIDSNGDGNLQVWEFYAIPNAQTDRFVCGGLCIAVVFGSAIGGLADHLMQLYSQTPI